MNTITSHEEWYRSVSLVHCYLSQTSAWSWLTFLLNSSFSFRRALFLAAASFSLFSREQRYWGIGWRLIYLLLAAICTTHLFLLSSWNASRFSVLDHPLLSFSDTILLMKETRYVTCNHLSSDVHQFTDCVRSHRVRWVWSFDSHTFLLDSCPLQTYMLSSCIQYQATNMGRTRVHVQNTTRRERKTYAVYLC